VFLPLPPGAYVHLPWKREFKLPWREAGPPYHHDDKVDSDQYVVNKELSLYRVDFASEDAGQVPKWEAVLRRARI